MPPPASSPHAVAVSGPAQTGQHAMAEGARALAAWEGEEHHQVAVPAPTSAAQRPKPWARASSDRPAASGGDDLFVGTCVVWHPGTEGLDDRS